MRLRDGLHWCACDGRALFLDISADRYFGLPAVMNEAFLRWAGGCSSAADMEALQQLIAKGLLVEGEPATEPTQAALAKVEHDLDMPSRLGLGDLIGALAAELSSSVSLRIQSFETVLASAHRVRPWRRRADPVSAARQIAGSAAAIALGTRSHDRCLVRGLAVYRRCRRAGIPAQLVFGVVGHPFAAHCWVQLGSEVLVGGYEQARLYTPILVIE